MEGRIMHMLRMLAVTVLLVSMGPKSSSADSTFFLFDTMGVYLQDGATLLPVNSVVQMVWSADMAYHAVTPGSLDAAGYLGSGDYLLFEGTTSIDGGWLSDLDGAVVYEDTDVGGAPLPSGFLYARVYSTQESTTNFDACDWWLQTPLLSVMNEATNVPPDSPDVLDVAPGGGAGPGGAAVLDLNGLAACPEPSTLAFALLGLAGCVAAMRRSGKLVSSHHS